MTKYDIDVICTFLSLFSFLFSIISLILSGITTKRILSFKNDLNDRDRGLVFMIDFSFYLPTKIYFGEDKHLQIVDVLREFSYKNILIVCGNLSSIDIYIYSFNV